MSVANGLRSPSTPPDTTNVAQTNGKRKRSDNADEVRSGGSTRESHQARENKVDHFGGWLTDILEVLKRYAGFYVLRVRFEGNSHGL